MWRTRLSATLLLIVVFAACARSNPSTAPPEIGRGSDTSRGAVDDLISLLNTPDFTTASELVVPGQAALAALAEGATFAQVADAIEQGDAAVASNFWAGFAQGAGSFLAGSVTTSDGPVVNEGDIDFHTVEIRLDDGSARQVSTREVDGFRIDLFASFGSGLAERMIPPVERLLISQTDDTAIVVSALKTVVPSLLVAANQDGLKARAVQDILRLVELITRVN